MNRTSVSMCLSTKRPAPLDDPQVLTVFIESLTNAGTGDGTRTRIYRLERPITSIQLVDPSILYFNQLFKNHAKLKTGPYHSPVVIADQLLFPECIAALTYLCRLFGTCLLRFLYIKYRAKLQ